MPARRPLPLVALLLACSVPACGPDRPAVPDEGRTPDAPGPTEPPPDGDDTLFREVSAAWGLDFTHELTLGGQYALPEISCSGCAVFDADGDGLRDVYFLNAGTGPGPGEGAPNRLFLQTAPRRFEDATETSGLGHDGYGFGAAVGDVDNDGDLDLFVANWGPDALFRNDGAGRFTDVTAASGIAGDGWSTSAAFVDVDADGFLDLYVVRYVKVDPTKFCSGIDSRRDYCSPAAFEPAADALYRNRGDGTFEDISREVGLLRWPAPGLGVVAGDFDGDGKPDVYVANDGAANQLWIREPDGSFREDALVRGLAFNGMGAAEASMGVAVGDVNGDGLDDVFLTHLKGETNTLYLGTKGGTFQDGTARSGLHQSSLGVTGFGTALFDVDHDGDLDLAAVNGRVEREAASSDASWTFDWNAYAEPNQLFLNDGKGRFEDASSRTGRFAARQEVSRGLAVADLDGDGDLDVVVTNGKAPARVYENRAPAAGTHWLELDVVDPALSRSAYGARVRVTTDDGVQTRTVGPASSYLSSSQISVHLGLGAQAAYTGIEVRWPDGTVERFDGGPADARVRIERGAGR